MANLQPQTEQQLRQSLRIPPDAERVLIFAESSHWDPNWLHTSEVYYRKFVERVLDRALEYLVREPRRVYTVESVFFLRMYWESRPEQQELVSSLVRDRRLRLSNPAVSTADTIIPSPEAILRDFLMGQEWLRTHGLEQETKLAYFPDSFGASPALPSLLRAAGFSHTAITRIDGMSFPGLEFKLPGKYPHPGSTAELLLKHERTLDFNWRDRAGAEVLCHWNAFSYFQGDLLAHRGFSRNVLFPLAVADRSEGNIARRVRRYASQLGPLGRTPYMFCPIGVDFISPIPKLVPMLERYNRKRYPDSGIWVVNAGLDDYLNLVDCYRDRLPAIELDPNPYWSGFYTSRPALKDRCHDLVDRILLAERLSFFPENAGAADGLGLELEQAEWTAAVSNHHDFITGTSPDPTVEAEQIPWLDAARAAADAAIARLSNGNGGPRRSPAANSGPGPVPSPSVRRVARPDRPSPKGRIPSWSREGELLKIRTETCLLALDAGAGGAIVSAQDSRTGAELLGGPSNDLISYNGSGGLWRMGHEFDGGSETLHARASDSRADFAVEERAEGLRVSWVSVLDGEQIHRSVQLAADSPLIRFRVAGRAARRRTLTVSFATDLRTDQLVMDVPGGVVKRPAEKQRAPTYWPFQHFLHLQDRSRDRGLVVFQRRPGAASYAPERSLELVALRNATRERAYHWFPVSGHPAGGFERECYTYEYALAFTDQGDWAHNGLPGTAYAILQDGWAGPLTQAVHARSADLLSVDRPDVWVLANKPASRGAGRVIRLYTHTAQGQAVTLRLEPRRALRAAFLCDARERDLVPLELRDGSITLTMPGSIASLRLIL